MSGTAIFGGTFDPIHNAHLALARAARDTHQLDRVLFIPAAQPPHKRKQPRASGPHRLKMIQLAIAGSICPRYLSCTIALRGIGDHGI